MKAEPSWWSSRTGLAKKTETGGGGGGARGGALDFFHDDAPPSSASSSVAVSTPLSLSLFFSSVPEAETLLDPTLVRTEGLEEEDDAAAADEEEEGVASTSMPPLDLAATTKKKAAAETRSTSAMAALDRAAAAAFRWDTPGGGLAAAMATENDAGGRPLGRIAFFRVEKMQNSQEHLSQKSVSHPSSLRWSSTFFLKLSLGIRTAPYRALAPRGASATAAVCARRSEHGC